jgi:glutathione S-transferase
MYLVVNVIMARKKYDVKYPNLYAPAGHKHAEAFNSAQRAHQQTLEGLPYFLMQLLVVGLYYPLFAAACGGLWNVGKIVYGYGYAKNGPTGRHVGGLIGHLGDMPLQVALFKIVYDLFQ